MPHLTNRATSLGILMLMLSACTAVSAEPQSAPTPTSAASMTSQENLANSDEETKAVIFDGIGFDYDPSLTASVTWEQVPPNADDKHMPLPDHTVFFFEETADSDNKFNRLTVYPLADLQEANPDGAAAITALRDYFQIPDTQVQAIPAFPTEGKQLFSAQSMKLDFQNGRGVRFISQYGNSPSPVSNEGIFYTYQGISNDGRHYISFQYRIRSAILADYENPDAFAQDYDEYLMQVRNQLDQLESKEFEPDLVLLDALIVRPVS